jgi:hypothetical protein
LRCWSGAMPTIRFGRTLPPGSRLRVSVSRNFVAHSALSRAPVDSHCRQPGTVLFGAARPLPASGTQPVQVACCAASVRPWHPFRSAGPCPSAMLRKPTPSDGSISLHAADRRHSRGRWWR